MHLEDCFYLVRVSFDAFDGDKTPEYLASCYPKDAFLWVDVMPLVFTVASSVQSTVFHLVIAVDLWKRDLP
jgi:hypothetical protein